MRVSPSPAPAAGILEPVNPRLRPGVREVDDEHQLDDDKQEPAHHTEVHPHLHITSLGYHYPDNLFEIEIKLNAVHMELFELVVCDNCRPSSDIIHCLLSRCKGIINTVILKLE